MDAQGRTLWSPSPIKPRSWIYCINGLENARRKDGQRPARRRMWLKRGGRISVKAAEASQDYELVEVDENEQVWTTGGSYLGTVTEIDRNNENNEAAAATTPSQDLITSTDSQHEQVITYTSSSHSSTPA